MECTPRLLLLFCDNIRELFITTNQVLHARTKHIELNYHFIREKFAQEQLITQSVRFRDQLEDIYIKALANNHFKFSRDKLRVVSSPSSGLRDSTEYHDIKDKISEVFDQYKKKYNCRSIEELMSMYNSSCYCIRRQVLGFLG